MIPGLPGSAISSTTWGGVHSDVPRAAEPPEPLPPGAQGAQLLPAEADEAMSEPPDGFASDGEGDRPIPLIPDEFEMLDEDEELSAVAHGPRAAAPAGDAAARAMDGALPVWSVRARSHFEVRARAREVLM
mmetsp:Transcript_4888/g.14408  ORF Transcript_4888/g.14408 Transcript_4888/m.14408 type:complete len:131 (-) Transcript_4888:359-751(-)